MQIYYHGAFGRDDVASVSPVEVDESEARNVFARVTSPRGALGIQFAAGKWLQFYISTDGTVHAEVLKVEEQETRSTTVNVPLAELLIEAAFRGEDLEQKIKFARVSWHDEKLKGSNQSVQRIRASHTTRRINTGPLDPLL